MLVIYFRAWQTLYEGFGDNKLWDIYNVSSHRLAELDKVSWFFQDSHTANNWPQLQSILWNKTWTPEHWPKLPKSRRCDSHQDMPISLLCAGAITPESKLAQWVSQRETGKSTTGEMFIFFPTEKKHKLFLVVFAVLHLLSFNFSCNIIRELQQGG